MKMTKYTELMDDVVWKAFDGLLQSSMKTTYRSDLSNLNSSINYNQVLSKQLEYCDDAIEALIENDQEKATELLTKAFFKNDKIYDYVITSGLYDKLAEGYGFATIPISSIPKDQKLIIKDNRSIKTTSIPLKQVEECYDSVYPVH